MLALIAATDEQANEICDKARELVYAPTSTHRAKSSSVVTKSPANAAKVAESMSLRSTMLAVAAHSTRP